MSEIQINGRIVARVVPEKTFVVGLSSLLNSELIFNFPLTYMPYLDDSKEVLQPFKFDEIAGEVFLYLHGKHEKIGNLSCKFSYNHFIHDSSNEFNLNAKLDLDLYKFKKIEELRKGDIQFDFRFETSVTVYDWVNLKSEKMGYIPSWFTQSNLNFSYTIPLSVWIKQIIPKLNFGNYELFEVPIPDKVIAEEFKNLIASFEKGKDFFVSGHYDEAVAHCRKIVEHIPKAFPIEFEKGKNPSQKERLREFIKLYITPKLKAESKVNFIEDRLTQLWNITSIPHHRTEPYFNRSDAEVIMFDTVSILSYIGKVLKFNEI